MPKKNTKIGLFLSSGTTLSYNDPESTSIKNEKDIKKWLKFIPELELICDVQPILLLPKEPEQVSQTDWIDFARTIKKHENDFDGFVLVHNIENITYTATALSFLLADFNKPLVCTGNYNFAIHNKYDETSLQKFEFLGTKANLINAVQVATLPHRDVSLMFGNQLVRANRAFRSPNNPINIFSSFRMDPIGQIDFGVKLANNILKTEQTNTNIATEMDNNIQVIYLYPSLPAKLLENLAETDARAILIQSTIQTNISPEHQKAMLEITKQGKRLIYRDIMLDENNKQHLVKQLDEMGIEATVVNNMTLESTLIKSMLALAQTKTPSRFSEFLQTNLAGEITTT
ncbi:MAG: asparaginase domain-containing protein [bacterium]